MDEPAVSYRVMGTGRPLVLIHGFAISYNIWRNLAPLLSRYFMIVMIELPGIGGSAMPAESAPSPRDAPKSLRLCRAPKLALGPRLREHFVNWHGTFK